EEAVTDPDLNAWYDRRGGGNADKSAWTFGAADTRLNGGTANMNLGGLDYLIQQNWGNAGGGPPAKREPCRETGSRPKLGGPPSSSKVTVRMTNVSILLLPALGLGGFLLHAQAPPTGRAPGGPTVTRLVQMFTGLETEWMEAARRKDRAALERFLADDYELRT